MKPCPFCAEEIQDAAIKCKHCGSFVSAAPSDAARRDRERAPKLERHVGPAERLRKPHGHDEPERRLLYSGFPSWRAFFGHYILAVAGGSGGAVVAVWIAAWVDATMIVRVAAGAAPVVVGAVAFWAIGLYRRSKTVRITTTNIETEYGILSKRIDVLELWRCRDVRYRQSLLDRVLAIAHIEIFTTDVTTPNLSVVGLPASRQLFEKIRDSIEIQRHARNVVGFVE